MPSITVTAVGETAVIDYNTTLFGFDAGQHSGESPAQALARVSAALGTPGVVRIYDAGNGAAQALKNAHVMGVAAKAVASFKYDPASVVTGTHDADIAALIRGVKYWCYYHEPDQSGRPFTPAQYIAAWQHIHGLAVGAQACLILTGYQLAARLPQFYPGDQYVDVIAVDPYSHAATDTAQSLFGPLLDVIAGRGKPAAIAETGCTYTDPAGVAAFVQSLAWLEGRVEFVSWFNTTAGGVDYQIDAIPAAAAAYAALPR